MSLVASFHLIDRSKLPELLDNANVIVKKRFFFKKLIDNYWEFLDKNSLQLETFKYKDYNDGVYLNVLDFLSEKHNIDLTQSKFQNEAKELETKRGVSIFFLTNEHKQKYLTSLNPENFDVTEIHKFNTEFDDDDDPETAIACKEAISSIHKNLKEITDDSELIIFSVGQ